MKIKDIFVSIIILSLFLSIFVFNTFSAGIDNVKKNWPLYRCNPTVMPFASYFGHDPVSNFTYCIQNMQTSYMGTLLEPVHYLVNVVQNTVGTLMKDVQWVRKKIENMVSNVMNVVDSIFGVFINILIQFQKIMIKLKDTIMKVVGTVLTLVYIVEGGIKTGESTMAGPIGSALKFVCFHPDTIIHLSNGENKKMSNVDVGDILMGGSEVIVSLKLKGNKDDVSKNVNVFYKLYSNELKENIYVTGEHYIFSEKLSKFIHVKDHPLAEKMENMYSNSLNCLVTSDHRIRIGEYQFWDWED